MARKATARFDKRTLRIFERRLSRKNLASQKTSSTIKPKFKRLISSLFERVFPRIYRGLAKGWFPKVWFPKGWFWRMFPYPKTRTKVHSDVPWHQKTGTRVHSDVLRHQKPERGYIRQNHPFTKLPFRVFSNLRRSSGNDNVLCTLTQIMTKPSPENCICFRHFWVILLAPTLSPGRKGFFKELRVKFVHFTKAIISDKCFCK